MILSLDIASSLPEFSIIEDNKIIYSKKIVKNENDKISDFILATYIDLDKKFCFSSKLRLLLVNTGPGSYTALRVGIAFLSGMSLAQNIDIIGISCLKLFSYYIKSSDINSSAFFIASSKDQNFIYLYEQEVGLYKIHKFEKKLELNKDNMSSVNKIYTNCHLPLINNDITKNKEIIKLNFNKLICDNLSKIKSLPREEIITPIYVSSNIILN